MTTKTDLTRHDITVLLVDDQAIVGETVRRMLAPEPDIVFHYCSDPAGALAAAIEISPTVILQDLVMPDIDGLTLVRFYRRHPQLKDVPLIVLSSKEEAITKAEAFALGANDYLVKLPDRIELVARIRYHSRGYINLLERNEAYEKLLKSQQELASELARRGGLRGVPAAETGPCPAGAHRVALRALGAAGRRFLRTPLDRRRPLRGLPAGRLRPRRGLGPAFGFGA